MSAPRDCVSPILEGCEAANALTAAHLQDGRNHEGYGGTNSGINSWGEGERARVMEALGVSYDDEDGTYWVLGKLAAYECATLEEAARLAVEAPDGTRAMPAAGGGGWHLPIARGRPTSNVPTQILSFWVRGVLRFAHRCAA